MFTDVFDQHTAVVFTVKVVKNNEDKMMPMIRARSKCSFCSMNMYYTSQGMFARNDSVTLDFYGLIGSADYSVLSDDESLFQHSPFLNDQALSSSFFIVCVFSVTLDMLKDNGWKGTLEEYMDDSCQCTMGLPDRACQDANLKGMVPDRGCPSGSYMCLQDRCHEVPVSSNERCADYRRTWGTDGICQCGCAEDIAATDPDCFYLSNYRLVDSKKRVKGKCGGVLSACHEYNGSCTVDAWTCRLDQYNDGKFCDCMCGYEDPDCLLDVPTNCPDNYVCTSGLCLSPPGWTCNPYFYAGGDVCDCGCGLVDPDCTNTSVQLIYCYPENRTYRPLLEKAADKTCMPNLSCIDALCGNGVVEVLRGEECDGGLGCDPEKCKCLQGYSRTAPISTSCTPICGDGLKMEEEECDLSPFCTSTCVCEQGHGYNQKTKKCSGCGNGEIDEEEECDGGEGCLQNCTCDASAGYEPSDPPVSDCVKTSYSDLLLFVSLGYLALTIGALWLSVIVWRFEQRRVLHKLDEKTKQSKASDGSVPPLPGQIDPKLMANASATITLDSRSVSLDTFETSQLVDSSGGAAIL